MFTGVYKHQRCFPWPSDWQTATCSQRFPKSNISLHPFDQIQLQQWRSSSSGHSWRNEVQYLWSHFSFFFCFGLFLALVYYFSYLLFILLLFLTHRHIYTDIIFYFSFNLWIINEFVIPFLLSFVQISIKIIKKIILCRLCKVCILFAED